MIYRWFAVALMCGIGILVLSCGDPQTLQSITVQPGTETVGAANSRD